MKRLRIGYSPNSPDLSHPGDRRRIVFWAKNRGHKIITDLNEPVDVILLSERADFGVYPKKTAGIPIILDLVDGYLAKENPAKDWFRGTSKVLVGQLTGNPKPFSTFVENLCLNASAVICSSPEQQATIAPFSKNVHAILDSHDELPLIPFGNRKENLAHQILWEGMPATIGGLKQIQSALTSTQVSLGLKMNFVTDVNYFQLLGKFRRLATSSLLKQNLGETYKHSKIIPWNTENLVAAAMGSDVAIIPIKVSSPLQYLKPENRLLIMWRLGLPCLTSPTPAYIRVANEADSETICHSGEEWEMKLRWILQNRATAEAIVKNGQSYLREFHNSEILLEKWDRAFQSIL